MMTETDCLVIGGGVIGVCTAYFLAQAGRGVTLVERDEIGRGSSYGNAGLIAVEHAIPLPGPGVLSQGLRWLLDPDSPFYIRPRLDPDLIRWLWRFQRACNREHVLRAIPVLLALGRASLALHDELHARHPLDDAYQRRGRLFLFRSPAGLEHGRQELALLKAFGVHGEVLDGAGVRARIPQAAPDVIGGIFYANYAHFHPFRFVQGMAAQCRALGVDIRTHTEVLALETVGRRVARVRTTRGDFRAREVVLAAGAWSPLLGRSLGLRLPIQPAKGYSVTGPRLPDYPEQPIQLSEAKVAVTPMGEALRFSSTLELVGFDARISPRRVEAARWALRTYLQGLEDLQEWEVWAGFRPLSPDDLPLIGRSPAHENLTLATGHGMLGMTHGPITGRLVAQLLTGEPPALDMAPLTPARFV